VSTFTANQLGGLQPILSDIMTPDKMANQYLAQKYTVDDTAMANRLGEYDRYDTTKFDGMKDYLTGKADAVTGNSAYYKKGSLNDILGGLYGIDQTNLANVAPLLSGVNSLGTMNGKSMYDAQAVKDQMNKYVVSQSGSDFSPYADLKKLATVNGYDYYSNAGDDLVADQLATDKYNLLKGGGTPGALYAPGFQDPRAIEAGKTYYSDPWGFSHEAQQDKDTPYYFAPSQGHTRSGTADTWFGVNEGPGISNAIYNGQSGYLYDPTQTDLTSHLTPERINDRYAEKKSGGGLFGAVFNFLDPILDTLDPMHDKAQNFVTKTGGFDSQEQAFSTIMPIIVDAFLPGVGSAASAVNSASTGNWAGALMSGLSAYTGISGNSLGITGNAAVDQALTKAAISGAGTAVSGGEGGDVLRNMALSGLGSYGGSMMGGYTQSMSPLEKIAANTAYGAGMGGLSSAIRGRDASQGATGGALSGLTNSSIKALLASQLYKG